MKTSDARVQFWTPEPVPAIPVRNRLYSPEPIGIGTAQVESLTSFMCRLAKSHCLSAGSMFLRMGGSSARSLITHLTDFKTSHSRCRSLGNDHSLNGFGTAAEEWVEVLGLLTGRLSLSLLTLLPLRGVVAGNHLFRARQAWCPCCFAHDRRQQIVEHNRLIWSFQILSRCLVHEVPLSEKCPYCGKTQSYLTSFSLPGYCAFCAEWLGNNEDTGDQHKIECPGDDFNGEFISGLLENYSCISQSTDLKPSFAEILQTNLQKCIERVSENTPAWLARAADADEKALASWRFEVGQAFSIRGLLRLASVLGFPADLLLGRMITDSEIIEAKSRIDLEKLKSARHRERMDVMNHLIEASRSQECPSLQQVAEKTGHKHTAYLRKLDASLCRLICKRNAERRRAMNLPRRNQRKRTDDEIRAALERALASAYPVTIFSIAQELGYQQCTRLHQKFRDLCQAILRKRRDHELMVQSQTKKILEDAIGSDPPPSLDDIRMAVGERAYKQLLSTEQELIRRLRAVQEELKKRALREALERALLEVPPSSFSNVCKKLGVDYKLPMLWFPDLSRAIVNRTKVHRSEEKARRLAEMEEEVLLATKKLRDAGIAPLQRTILTMISSTKSFGFCDVSRAVLRARKLLEWPEDGDNLKPRAHHC
ncbi:MAG: TniQ family protein [Terracidiphilus sp.]